MSDDASGKRHRALLLLMLAVTGWGGLLALGAFLFGYDAMTAEVSFAPNLARGGIVLTCVLFFLGGWIWLVRRRFK